MMKDPRITVRMTEEQHKSFKIVAIKNNTTMNELLLAYIQRLIETEMPDEKK